MVRGVLSSVGHRPLPFSLSGHTQRNLQGGRRPLGAQDYQPRNRGSLPRRHGARNAHAQARRAPRPPRAPGGPRPAGHTCARAPGAGPRAVVQLGSSAAWPSPAPGGQAHGCFASREELLEASGLESPGGRRRGANPTLHDRSAAAPALGGLGFPAWSARGAWVFTWQSEHPAGSREGGFPPGCKI